MELSLWRHAEAHDLHEGETDDLARALTPKGERQAAHMAQWLSQTLPAATRILVSPALRTQQTAAALERRFETVQAIEPGATVDALLGAARWPEARDPVMVVGHQPTLGLTAARLLCGAAQPWSIPKAGVWWLRCRERGGQQQVVLLAVRSPAHL
jgi:phosphohistidine phosphatase